jgi:hypothetical protein
VADLLAYLRARLDEDEAELREALALAGTNRGGMCVAVHRWQGAAASGLVGVMSWDPERALAEVAARRAILDLAERLIAAADATAPYYPESELAASATAEQMVTLSAQIYSLRPDFDPAWRA